MNVEEAWESNTPIEGDRLMTHIQALEWVQGLIQDLVINKERKGGSSI
jgi:hypothetical protein